MLPYHPQPAFHLGPVTIHLFGILVASALIVGQTIVTRRTRRLGLKFEVAENLVWYAILAGFVGAHLYSALVYFPDRVFEEPLYILKFWDGISSFGSMVGGLIGMWIFFRFKAPQLSAVERWRYVDALAFAFPFAWIFGRLGCTFAFDHPGTITTFPLGFSLKTEAARDYIMRAYENAGRFADLPPASELPNLAFHNLGFYEMLYSALVIAPVFLWLDRKPRKPGFFLVTFFVLYAPVRFALDFLRIADVHYFGLTGGQYAAVAVFAFALFLLVWKRSPIRTI